MLVVCVNNILVAVIAVQKLIEGSNRVGMTQKFTKGWIDASACPGIFIGANSLIYYF